MSLTELKPGNESYDWIYKQMHDSIVTHADGLIFDHYDNVKVYKVENPSLWSLYEQRKAAIFKGIGGKEVKEVTLYHGTEDAMNIIKNGFDLQEAGGKIGKDVNFAEHSSKSNQRTKAWYKACQEHQKQNCPMCVRHMLVCKVTMGNALCDLAGLNDFVQPPKVGLLHMSVKGDEVKTLGCPEYIVYKVHQAYPAYLVEYQIKYVQEAAAACRCP